MCTPINEPEISDGPQLPTTSGRVRRILITGASGSLGQRIAFQLAEPGVELLLWARDAERLSATGEACRAKGARVQERRIELSDPNVALSALSDELVVGQIDQVLLIAGQGDMVPQDLMIETPDQVARLIAVNFSVPAALMTAVAERMVLRGTGRILVVGSAAASHSLPQAPGYAASKAGLSRFALALGVAVAPAGVFVTLVSPGFIDWSTNDRPIPRALKIAPEEAARRILGAFQSGVAHATIPRRFIALRWLDRVLPEALRNAVLRKLKP